MTVKPPLKFLQCALGFQHATEGMTVADAHRVRIGLLDHMASTTGAVLSPMRVAVPKDVQSLPASMTFASNVADDVDTWLVPMPAWATARDKFDEIMRLSPADMPPNSDHLSLLLDTVLFRLREPSRAATWEAIGVPAPRGRAMLGARSDSVTWPTFFTLRVYAFGDEMETR
jgi:hypothetical protein